MNRIRKYSIGLGPMGKGFRVEFGVGIILLVLAIMAFVSCSSGCATRLDPTGVYKGDVVLYEADTAVVEGHGVLQDFVNWEANNREVLASVSPEIRKAADRIVAEGPRWFTSASVLRDAYRANPNPDTKSAFVAATDVIKAAIHEATGYISASKSVAPPPPAIKAPTLK